MCMYACIYVHVSVRLLGVFDSAGALPNCSGLFKSKQNMILSPFGPMTWAGMNPMTWAGMGSFWVCGQYEPLVCSSGVTWVPMNYSASEPACYLLDHSCYLLDHFFSLFVFFLLLSVHTHTHIYIYLCIFKFFFRTRFINT